MPSGKTHFRTEILLLPLFLLIFYLIASRQWNDLSLFALAYLISSLWLSPDLDLKQNTTRNRWGRFSWIWTPYAKLFKHRGVSHHPIWGSLTRLLYLCCIIASIVALLWTAGLEPPPLELVELLETRSLLIFVGGLYVPNLIHVLLDVISRLRLQARKRQKKQRHIQEV